MAGRLRDRLADESGLTLIELLVTMITAIIVSLALFAFQDIVLRGSGRTIARADATQRARIALTTLESRLHSSCIADGVTPIQSGSTGTSLSFISAYGSAATLIPQKHTVALQGNGSLTDKTYALVSGTAANDPVWAGSPSSTVAVLDNVSASGSTPIFTYYAYGVAKDSSGKNYLDAAGQPYLTLLDGTSTLPDGITTLSGDPVPAGTMPANSPAPLPATAPGGLSSSNAGIASAVSINMVVQPAGKLSGSINNPAPATVSDSVVLRLTPVPSEGNNPSVPPCA